MELILTKKAYRAVVEECTAFPEVETGGILVGKKIGGQNIVVPFALGSGPKAKRSWTRFTPDVDWQQEALEKLFNRYQVNYVGSFHRHPGCYRQPSSLDAKTAQEIISSPDWAVSEAVFPIIIFKRRKVEIYPYYISRSSKGFHPIPWQIVPTKSRLVRAALRRRSR
jgi:integrative and conjugative element protein (TIGR02256 family)